MPVALALTGVAVLLGLSACQTAADGSVTSKWSSAPMPPVTRASGGQGRLDQTSGTLLLADARGGPAHFQALRFVAVSLVAFGFSLLLET